MNACSPNKQWYHYGLLLQFETRRFASRRCLSSVTITFATLKRSSFRVNLEIIGRESSRCDSKYAARVSDIEWRETKRICLCARQIPSLHDREFWKWALRDRWTSHRCDSPHVAGGKRVGGGRGARNWTSIVLEVEGCTASTCSSFLERGGRGTANT